MTQQEIDEALEYAESGITKGPFRPISVAVVLAAAYRSLLAENTRLGIVAERDYAARMKAEKQGEVYRDQWLAAKAEIERLRKALEEVASMDDDCALTHEHPARCCIKESFIAEHAKEALEKR